ncbi:MAG: methyltransferase domain-containing protein [Acidobacteria bacterium]|nr:MAG: methyltransferase domain-containing protein [Acidobacteriota bacterium]REK01452.1 MAG: methyltransferase domain-containing protein [Acidobacteriota bacterium]REK14408.1 MAG: methyltransferase domain-containing protein [Acidobacteriota bacterium]REK45123.1 MAG: methyltransferase domain-containing protein [Acidobacteriota bacterium]
MSDKPKLVQRIEKIEELCTGRSVLHLGCTNWPYTKESLDNDSLLHLSLDRLASELYGFDFDENGLEILRGKGVQNLYRANLEHLNEVDLDRRFEVIVAGEMIEHLTNPGLFLRGIKRFMDRDTRLVITTVNAYCGMRFVQYALRGKGGTAEPVHPDHVSYFSYRTLRLLVEKEDLEVREFFFYDLGKEHRPHNPRIWNIVNDILVGVSNQLSDGVIAVCGLPENGTR